MIKMSTNEEQEQEQEQLETVAETTDKTVTTAEQGDGGADRAMESDVDDESLGTLERLEAAIDPQVLFASQSPEDVRWEVPGTSGRSWVSPRLLNASEMRRYRQVTNSNKMVVGGGGEDVMETVINWEASYRFLCRYGIRDFHFESGDVVRERGNRDHNERVFRELSPQVADWLEYRLRVFNGLTAEAVEKKGSG